MAGERVHGTAAHQERLAIVARALGMSVNELVFRSSVDLSGLDDERFFGIARGVVTRNHELYKRLA
jgi:hypothetical protein